MIHSDKPPHQSLLSPRQLRAKPWHVRYRPNKSLAIKLGLGAFVLTLFGLQGYGFFVWGQRSVKVAIKSPAPSGLAGRTLPTTKRWSKTGTVISVSDKEIKIKEKSGETTTIRIDAKTAVSKTGGEKLAIKDIRRDSSVITSGIRQDDGSLLAQRVRLL